MKNKRVKCILLFVAVVLFWALGATAVWSGKLKPLYEQNSVVPLKAIQLVIGSTTWPGHEIMLEISGKGFGANAGSKFSVLSLLVFLVYSVLLWSPLLILLLPKGLPPAISVQIVLLAVVFALFWKFGNG